MVPSSISRVTYSAGWLDILWLVSFIVQYVFDRNRKHSFVCVEQWCSINRTYLYIHVFKRNALYQIIYEMSIGPPLHYITNTALNLTRIWVLDRIWTFIIIIYVIKTIAYCSSCEKTTFTNVVLLQLFISSHHIYYCNLFTCNFCLIRYYS